MNEFITEILKPLAVTLAPYTVKCLIVILICSGIFKYIEKKKELPKILKAAVPVIVAIIAQFLFPEHIARHSIPPRALTDAAFMAKVKQMHFIDFILRNLGIGIAVGAIATTFYDTAIKFIFRFIKKKRP
jgi:chromate transport protein ChrA